MNFTFSDEQQLLAETARSYARDKLGPAAARAYMADEWREADAVWRELAQMGWLGLLVPEHRGGAGGSLVDACILLEELSRALAPIPFEGNAILAAAALDLLGSPEQASRHLPELAAGRRFAAVLDSELRWPPASGPGLIWQWTPDASPWVVEGHELRVLEQKRASPAKGQDLLHAFARLEDLALEKAPVDPSFLRSEAARRFLATAQVASSAALVGTMAGALDLSTAYASEREQYGKKIGSFQAVAHLCADMLVDLESARSVVYAAAWTTANRGIDEASRLAAMAKAWCAEASLRVCECAVQVHGGIGCTWESDVHLYLRAAHLEAAAFGGAEAALEQVAALALDTAQGDARGPQ
jgi:alkylation response protein AidB-like acyl-CoA dehydrogenase